MTQQQIVKFVDNLSKEDFKAIMKEWSKRNKSGSGASVSRCGKYVRLFKEAWQLIYNEKFRFHTGQFDKQCVRDWFIDYLLKKEFSEAMIARLMNGTRKEIETVQPRITDEKSIPVLYQLPSIYIRKFQKYLDEHESTN